MFRPRLQLSVLTALLLLGGVLALPNRITIAKHPGLQQRAPEPAAALLVAFDSDDDDTTGGYDQPVLIHPDRLNALATHAFFAGPSLAPSGWRAHVEDRRPATLVGTIVLLM